ncbi:substrate-binding periplasmic protein [Inhella sp.]|uniref:substrate-binding periplasmic protein n=1 Tax=Inhella sp. TaxID=1921806 RepID=UPI0035AE0AFC
MRSWIGGTLLALCVGLGGMPAASASSCKQLRASGNPQYPPYLWRDPANEEVLVGANAELMAWLSKEIGIPIEVRFVGPWSRVQEEARAGRLDLLAGAFFTLPRTEFMDYVYPPFRETRSVVMVRGDKKLNFKRWDDLIPHQGITVINNSFGEQFDRFAAEKLRITKVASLEQAIRMVELGRGDYLLYEDSPADAYLARMAVQGFRTLMPAVAQEQLYVTLSQRSECNSPELRGALTRAMYKLQRERLMPEFVARAVKRWQAEGAAAPKP